MNVLQASIDEREKRISKLRVQKNKIEDAVFTAFCKQIRVANIRYSKNFVVFKLYFDSCFLKCL
jgi:hypothetical protein